MSIKERKLIVFFLKSYLSVLEKQTSSIGIHPGLRNYFSRKELLAIIKHIYTDEQLSKLELDAMENDELIPFLKSDANILQYYIDTIEHSITKAPILSGKEVNDFFTRIGMETHYLFYKPTIKWDEYDRSNYYSLLFKHGKTKRVFAIFTSDVEEEEKYAVTTQPSYFFDTEEEAEEELEKILSDGDFKRDELKIMSLWQIN